MNGLIKTSINIPEKMMEEIEKICKSKGYKKSEFIREAIRKMIEEVM